MSQTTTETPVKAAVPYSSSCLEKKLKNKTLLQEELGWPSEPKRPVVCLPMGLSKETGGEIFEQMLEGLYTLPVELLILGKGSEEYGKLCTKLALDQKHRTAIIPNTAEAKRKMYAAADMALFLTEPSDKELRECLHYGVVPISPDTKALEAYNPIQESGTSFLYGKTGYWNAFAGVVRALETQQFPFDWRTIQKACMKVSA